jgi:hypothetical protein
MPCAAAQSAQRRKSFASSPNQNRKSLRPPNESSGAPWQAGLAHHAGGSARICHHGAVANGLLQALVPLGGLPEVTSFHIAL